MVVLCEGRRREGFYICRECGVGFRKHQNKHKTPYGQDCHGTLEQVSLGHEFATDVLQLQFLDPKPEGDFEPVWFAYSPAYALDEGAAGVLELPSTDINATVAHRTGRPVPPIIPSDNVPGGAGLVARLEDEKFCGVAWRRLGQESVGTVAVTKTPVAMAVCEVTETNSHTNIFNEVLCSCISKECVRNWRQSIIHERATNGVV